MDLTFEPRSADDSPEQFTLSVPTHTQHIGTVRSFVESVGAHYELPEERIEDLKLAVSEICGEANESPTDGRIRVRITHSDSSLDIEVAGIGTGRIGQAGGVDEAPAFRRRLIHALIPDATFDSTEDGMAVRFTVATPG